MAELLEATVGPDQAELWQHRTEPLQLVVDVDDLLSHRTDARSQDDDAEHSIGEQQLALEQADPYPDEATYGWSYKATGPNQLTAVDPAAPEWSWDTWRTLNDNDNANLVERSIHDGDTFFTSLFIPDSPASAVEYYSSHRRT
ncbi:hypothetical protein BWO91_14570 [Plantibacter flavus]|uniref:hypothetical protein n=1 Tax=Plantibacter flavus TaxID=150123 RepID=UPI00099D8282|nr:hypothetical protein [Plantibacter flavus]AQX81030.1 hypothetical protein BWO91_14570 [Plantibacter flavus]